MRYGARSLLSLSLLAAAGLLAPQAASAADADEGVTLDVTGGVDAKACAYPSVVLLNTYVDNNPKKRASCTGTLIHPKVILYAAHCGTVNEAAFTENRTTPGRRTLTRRISPNKR